MQVPAYRLSGPPPAEESVRHHVPGGCEDGGGIGRLIGYVVEAQPVEGTHLVQDTRGPRWRPLPSALRLGAAILALAGDRIRHPGRVQHIHIAGRGSTARKLILTAAARALGSTHLLHLHDFDYAADFIRRPAWQQRLIRHMFRRADRVVVLGERDRDTALGLLGVPADRVSILRNCVPDPGPPPARPDHRMCRIVFLGQLGPRKGVPELLAALAHPAMQGVPWRATLAGGGPVEDYRTEARRLGLGERVAMPGWLTEPQTRALCAGADILVLPSHGEGMAMAVLEGLAHGLAVVTTRVGAHGDVLEHDRTCLFVPVGDAEALAATLARLVRDPAQRRRIAEAGRALYLSDMAIHGYVRRLSDLHRDLAAPRHLQGDPA
ncbi:glycosyltransferase family 4 protein [Falsirhodobacter algicola]|uniref:Glycosyltransferase n=1 Tax=Falsirhodobacter algicola TaxID=2692330 RepID=A0A8J8MRI3_9RHOB|nr:glycosyltransferase family 4 protein [Falsirhodobacter algicola]QUS35119.1 glycosyltransferase [Falsirhodobacter algicola]